MSGRNIHLSYILAAVRDLHFKYYDSIHDPTAWGSAYTCLWRARWQLRVNNRSIYSSLLPAKGVRKKSSVLRDTLFVCMSGIHRSFMLHVVCLFLTLFLCLSVCSPCWSLSTGIIFWRWASMALFSSALPLMLKERWVVVVRGQNLSSVQSPALLMYKSACVCDSNFKHFPLLFPKI